MGISQNIYKNKQKRKKKAPLNQIYKYNKIKFYKNVV